MDFCLFYDSKSHLISKTFCQNRRRTKNLKHKKLKIRSLVKNKEQNQTQERITTVIEDDLEIVSIEQVL